MDDATGALMTLDDLADRIRVAHTDARRAFTDALQRAMDAGDLLLVARARVAHGEWLPWLRDACELPERTAQLYMRLARNRPAIEAQIRTVADFGVRDAVALLTEPREALPPPAVLARPVRPEEPAVWPSTYEEAISHAAALLAYIADVDWYNAQLTYTAVVGQGLSIAEFCAAAGWSLRAGYHHLAMWTAHGGAVLAGRWQDVPEFWPEGVEVGLSG